jgi:hypothetical protein
MLRPKFNAAAVTASVIAFATMTAGCVAPSTSTGSSAGTFSVASSHSGSGAPTAASAGRSVRDGKFEFRVLDISRAAQVGSPDGNQFMQT